MRAHLLAVLLAVTAAACAPKVLQLTPQGHEMDAHVVVITSQLLGAGECGACVTLVATAYRRKSS